MELLAGWYAIGVDEQREEQVLAAFRFPRVLAAATSCRLAVGHANGSAFAFGWLIVAQVAIGGVHLVESDELCFHVLTVSAIGLQ